jgi:hypothetical protein
MVEDKRHRLGMVLTLLAIASFFAGLLGYAWTGTWQWAVTGLATGIVGVLTGAVVARV